MSLRPGTTYPYHPAVRLNPKPPLKLARWFALIVFLTSAVTAQTKNDAGPLSFNPAVYRLGERLTYNVSYSQFVSAAHIEMVVAGRGIFFEREGIQLKAHVETTGVVNVALLSLNNDYTTYVFAENGLPYRSQQVVREAGRTHEASLDYNQPAGTDAIPAKLKIGESAGIYDLLSAVYHLRAMPLTMGAQYFISVRHGNEEYQAEIKVAGKEYVKTSVGSFDAIVTKIKVKGAPVYDLRVYFSDDEWHVPVLLTAKNGDDAEVSAELAASKLEAPLVTPPTSRGSVNPATQVPNNRTPPGPAVTPSNSVLTSGSVLDLPFKIGEQLNYQVYLGKGTQPVGTLNFTFKERGRYFNRDGLQLTASAQTTGAGTILAVKDSITSYVDPATLLPFRTEINFSEGKYKTSRTYNLDQDRGSATTENSREKVDIPIGTHDLLSALYSLRTFAPIINKQNAVSLMAIHKPRALMVTAKSRETLELNGQKIAAIMLELKTDDPQPDKLQIRIWVGDDSRHLPLRITAVTEVGPIRADLIVVPKPR
jgi:Protein of unknown function (DUF3108)